MIKCILTDIEGTTSSIDFVHKVLFPYSRERMQGFITTQKHSLQDAIDKIWTEDLGQLPQDRPDLDIISSTLVSWIDQDLKHPALKYIQGKIWRQGFEKADFKGHVYSDVPPCLNAWREKGIQLAVYSSGSVEAQKLLFGYTEYGDLTGLFSDFFDTAIGTKREASSYRKIAETLVLPPSTLLFLSDVVAELDAAALVGYQTCQLLRSDNLEIGKHKTAKTFLDVEHCFLSS